MANEETRHELFAEQLPGEYHWKDSFFFKREPDGGVRIRKRGVFMASIPLAEWVSIFAAMMPEGPPNYYTLLHAQVNGFSVIEKEMMSRFKPIDVVSTWRNSAEPLESKVTITTGFCELGHFKASNGVCYVCLDKDAMHCKQCGSINGHTEGCPNASHS